jgi:hypothetical protein
MRPRILLIDAVGRPQCYTELRAALDTEWLTELTPALYPDHAAFDAMDRAALQVEISHLRGRQEEQAQEITALKRQTSGSPMLWLRAAMQAVVPARLRHALPARRRPQSWRQLPSWATPARATRPATPGGDGKDSDG